MKRNNQKMKVQGFDSSLSPVELTHEQPFSDVSSQRTYGMPITVLAFLNMIKLFKASRNDTNMPPFKDVLWIEFSKASIFRILSQEDCEYIRFYMAIPNEQNGKASLSLQGLDSKFNPIKKELIEKVGEAMEEQISTGRFSDDATLMQTFDELPPNLEEKGNEGVWFNDSTIKSLNKFMSDKGSNLYEMKFGEFIKTLHSYQQEYS